MLWWIDKPPQHNLVTKLATHCPLRRRKRHSHKRRSGGCAGYCTRCSSAFLSLLCLSPLLQTVCFACPLTFLLYSSHKQQWPPSCSNGLKRCEHRHRHQTAW